MTYVTPSPPEARADADLLHRCFVPEKAKGATTPETDYRRFEWIEGQSVEDDRYFGLCADLAEELPAAAPPDEPDDNGLFSGSGVVGRFDRIGALFSRPSLPLHRNPFDARLLRAPDYEAPTAEDRVVFDIVADLLCPPESAKKARSIKLNKYSSSGAPYRSRDPDFKIASAVQWCQRYPVLAELFATGDFEGFRQRGYVFLNTGGERAQGDPPGKKRLSFTFEGDFRPADYSLPEELAARAARFPGVEFRRYRRRAVSVVPDSTFPIYQLGADWLQYQKTRYPRVFAHTTAGQLEQKLASFAFYAFGDLGEHENRFDPLAMIGWMERISANYSPSVALNMALALRMPQFVKGSMPGSRDWGFFGNPFDILTYKARYFWPSGMKNTTPAGNMWACQCVCAAAVRAGLCPPTREAIDRLMIGLGRYGFCLAGDNSVLGTSDKRARDAWVECFLGMKYIRYGEANTILGLVPHRGVGGELRLHPSLESLVLRLIQPSRSAHDPQAGDALQGARARLAYYSTAPLFERVLEVLDRLILKWYQFKYSEGVPMGETQAVISRYELIKQRLRDDPDRIHFDGEAQDLPELDVSEYFTSLPVEEGAALLAGMAAFDSKPGRRRLCDQTLHDVLYDYADH